MTNSYKTVQWWFTRYPSNYGFIHPTSGEVTPFSCPCCSMHRETVDHLFGECMCPDQERTRGLCDYEASQVIAAAIIGSEVTSLFVDANDIAQVVCELLRGEGGRGRFPFALEKIIVRASDGDSWRRHTGIVHSALYSFMLGCLMRGKDVEAEICTYSLGAKMGIGKDRDCKCSKCLTSSVVSKAYNKVVKLYMQCGLDLWSHRCERWVEYKEVNHIITPGINSGGLDTSDYAYHEEWEADWGGDEGADGGLGEELADTEGQGVGEGSWVSVQSDKYVNRQQQHSEFDRLTRVYCGYPVKPSKREREGAVRNEAGRSHDMLQYLTNSGELGDSEAMELKVGIDEIIHNLYLDDMGCEEHDLQPGDRVDDVLDLENCQACKLMYYEAENDMRQELDLPIIRSTRRRATESSINFNSIPEVKSILALQWCWLDPSWKAMIGKRAKATRADKCGHYGKRKGCEACTLAQLHAQYQWEVDHPAKKRKCLQQHSFSNS